MPRRDRPSPALTSAAACLLLLGSWAAAQAGAAADAPVMDGVAVVSEGNACRCAGRCPARRSRDGGFVLTRIAPDGSARRCPSPRRCRPRAPVDAETYEAIELFDPTLVPGRRRRGVRDRAPARHLRARGRRRPDLARALGILVDHDGVALGERWRYEVATGRRRAGRRRRDHGRLHAPARRAHGPGGRARHRRHRPALDAADERTLVFGYRVEVRGPTAAFADLGGGWLTPPSVDDEDPDPYWLVDDTSGRRAPGRHLPAGRRDLFGRETPPSATVAYTVTDPTRPAGDHRRRRERRPQHHPALGRRAGPAHGRGGVLRAASLDDTPQLVSPLFPPTSRWTDEGCAAAPTTTTRSPPSTTRGSPRSARCGRSARSTRIRRAPPRALGVDPRTDGLDLAGRRRPRTTSAATRSSAAAPARRSRT
jgi:hypothetical protein